MAVIVYTSNPQELLNSVKEAIDHGKIDTWKYDEDGDFTHYVEQWRWKAWLRPRTADEKLIFNILPPKNTRISKRVYGIYHGRLIEMLLTHFDERFERAIGTAMPTVNDRLGTASN